jgi:hypothetical protein
MEEIDPDEYKSHKISHWKKLWKKHQQHQVSAKLPFSTTQTPQTKPTQLLASTMHFTATLFSTFALLMASQVMGAAIDNDQIEAREAAIATSPCPCPSLVGAT